MQSEARSGPPIHELRARQSLEKHLGSRSSVRQVELIWLPVLSSSGVPATREVSELNELQAPQRELAWCGKQGPAGGRIIDVRIAAPVLHYPVWLLHGEDGASAAVSAVSGRVLLSNFPADRRRSQGDLVLVLLLALYGLMFCAFLSEQLMVLPAFVFGAGAHLHMMFLSPAVALGCWWLVRRYLQGTMLPSVEEAIARAQSSRVSERLPGAHRRLLGSIGWLVLSAALLSMLASLAKNMGPLIAFVDLIAAVALFFTLRNHAGPASIETPVERTLENTRFGVVAALLGRSLGPVFVALLLASIYNACGFGVLQAVLTGAPATEGNRVEGTLVRLAICLALWTSDLRLHQRLALIAALLIPLAFEQIWSPFAIAAATAIVVWASGAIFGPKKRRPLAQRLTKSIAAAFFGRLGNFGGGLIGALLLGTLGLSVGSVLGEELALAFAVSDDQEEEVRIDAQPPPEPEVTR